SRTRRQEKRSPPTAATPASSSSAHRFPTSKNSLTSRLFDTLNRSCSGGKGRLPSIIVLICLRYGLGSYFGNSPSVLHRDAVRRFWWIAGSRIEEIVSVYIDEIF